jgi:peptidoglycan hydrolase-like protein with peptidoglycan-binding domain
VSATELQRALLRAGFDPGPVDGKLGKKTKAAVKAFQRKQGLTADGVVGEKTWSALSAY